MVLAGNISRIFSQNYLKYGLLADHFTQNTLHSIQCLIQPSLFKRCPPTSSVSRNALKKSPDFIYFSAKYFRIDGLTDDKTYGERELFHRIARGDEEAFTQFYKTYGPRLAAYIGSLLSSDLWAEELVQDVFLKLWLARTTLTTVDYPQAFLFRMAANRTWDHLKQNSKEVQLQYRIAQLEEGSSKNFTEEGLDLKISEELYKEAIKQLPAQRRTAYQLKHEEGLSYEEIAERLGISKNTVRNQIVAASQSVRSYMIKKGGLVLFLIYTGSRVS